MQSAQKRWTKVPCGILSVIASDWLRLLTVVVLCHQAADHSWKDFVTHEEEMQARARQAAAAKFKADAAQHLSSSS